MVRSHQTEIVVVENLQFLQVHTTAWFCPHNTGLLLSQLGHGTVVVFENLNFLNQLSKTHWGDCTDVTVKLQIMLLSELH